MSLEVDAGRIITGYSQKPLQEFSVNNYDSFIVLQLDKIIEWKLTRISLMISCKLNTWW